MSKSRKADMNKANTAVSERLRSVVRSSENVPHLFRAQAKRTPDQVALTDGRRSLTYRELDDLTDRLAMGLSARGIGLEQVVGCWIHTSYETVVYVLSILKAGGAYLLLDAHLPQERVHYMINDAEPVGIVADRSIAERLAGDRPVWRVDELAAEARRAVGRPPEVGVRGDSLAYMAYTSGSTGRPKGVLITHGATVNHALAFGRLFELRPGDRTPLMAPQAFDMATEEMIPPLLSGCTLFDIPPSMTDMAQFSRDVTAQAYTILNIPAPLWHQWTVYLAQSGESVPASLRLLIVGSEKMYTRTYNQWRALPGAEAVRWVAAYGVTEATVTSTVFLPAGADDLRDEPIIPIGSPIDGVCIHVVGDDGAVVRQGDVGELHIGGMGVARGYHRLPHKTEAQFAADDYCSEADRRLYRTGDLVRQRPDGALVWLGRRDEQIKINGLRIEPAEIESVVQEHPDIEEAVVLFREASNGGSGRLTAFVEATSSRIVEPQEVRRWLGERLLPAMVPARIVVLREMPVNANGKLDRKALASMEQAQ
jgi:amino acid adenylation domain-containing protein